MYRGPQRQDNEESHIKDGSSPLSVFLLYFAEIITLLVVETNSYYHDYSGADKSLARPGRKQARKHVTDACDFNNIETRAVIKFFSCKAQHRRKFMPL